jgi:short-subunit dehydrogenase
VLLDDASVLVTGATGGVGRALCARLARRGARLVVSGRHRSALEDLASATGARAVVADLSEPDGVATLVAEAGTVDVLVANAAVPASGQLTELDDAEVRRALEVNLAAPVRLAHALLPGMLARRQGYLLFVSSLQGLAPTPGASLYVATKFGLRGFALALRQDLHGTGVGSGVLLPGFVRDAGMFAGTGVTLPRGIGTRSPDQVAASAVRQIERDRPEAAPAPPLLAAGAYLSGLAPGPAGAVQRLLGAAELARAVADAQRSSGA